MQAEIISGSLTLGTSQSAGYDILCMADVVLPPGIHLIPTGLRLSMTDCWFLIKERSSLDYDVKAGVVDPDYRGEIKVKVRLHKETAFFPGMRIAQGIFMPVIHPIQVKPLVNVRGEGGFGSTGA